MENKTEFPTRKRNRLKQYDYSSCGAYFITVCTLNRRNYFWKNVVIATDDCTQSTPPLSPYETPCAVGATSGRPQNTQPFSPYETPCAVGVTSGRPQNIELTPYGEIINEAINYIPIAYPALSIGCYTIMPNHIHILLQMYADESGRPLVAPTISRVVNQLKGYVSRRAGAAIWQKSFHDHIIRSREDYEEHQKYICENALRWYYDELYTEE